MNSPDLFASMLFMSSLNSSSSRRHSGYIRTEKDKKYKETRKKKMKMKKKSQKRNRKK